MKWLLLLSFALLLFQPLFAQEAISRVDNSDVLHIGSGNKIEFHTKGIPENELEIKASRGNLVRNKDGQYIFWTAYPGIMHFSYYWENKEIGRYYYTVLDWPRATALFGSVEDEATLGLAGIKSILGIKVSYMNTNISWDAKIGGYRMRIIRNKKAIYDRQKDNLSLFDEEQKQ